jgi:tetratricopeptide (TPR) repeat protein
VAFDRNGTLRNAEKLLRQGKLEAAVAEYLRVVEDQPTDWNTANTLGDLYARTGQIDKAVEEFLKIADSLREEGQFVKAAAIYKKILKLKPDHERALLQAADLVASQGLFADARAYLNTVLEKRLAASDVRGAAMARVRLGGLDPSDYAARVEGARARLDMNDVNGAVSDLRAIAEELTEKSRFDEAIEALRQAAAVQPDDEEVKTQLFDIYVSAEDFVHAGECASTAAQLTSLADSLELRERHDEMIEMLRRATQIDADDMPLRARLAKTFLARGDLQSAADYLTADTAGDDPQLLLTLAEIQLRGGKMDEGLALVRRLIEEDPARREDLAALGSNIATQAPEAGFAVVELSAEAAVASNDWASAAAALQEYVARVPSFIPALMRLVEICVDGGLEEMMYGAQAQLADAYIAIGSVAEARYIAEDLVAREPWERSNIERFRRTLEMLGEPDPDGIIAERLSGETPFTSTDLLAGGDLTAAGADAAAPLESDGMTAELRAMLEEAEGPSGPPPAAHEDMSFDEPEPAPAPVLRASKGAPKSRDEGDSHFELSSNAIDLESILGDLDEPAPPPAPKKRSKRTAHAAAAQESVEVDLSIDLDGMHGSQAAPVSSAHTAAAEDADRQPVDENDIDSVFAQLRTEASRRSTGDAADEQLKQGMALRQAGKIDHAIAAFETASRSPRHRFQASALIGRIYREREQMSKAIEWFERATQAPAPSPEDGHTLLYELADALEATGEVGRALAICMELQADAGDFRDVKARVSRLSQAQAQG